MPYQKKSASFLSRNNSTSTNVLQKQHSIVC